MAGFPPDVEGGELWPPPGLFLEEMYHLRTPPTAKIEGHFPSELTASMEELAHRLAYAILDETHHRSPQLTPILSPSPQTLRSSHGCRRFEHSASHICCCRQKPVQASAMKPSLGATQILLKLSHNQPLLMSRIRSQNRGLPFRVVGSGARGFIRESGGTGVFLPRVAYNDAATAGMRRRPKMMSIEEEPSPLTNVGFGNGIIDLKTPSVVGSPPKPSEIVLPSEWTY